MQEGNTRYISKWIDQKIVIYYDDTEPEDLITNQAYIYCIGYYDDSVLKPPYCGNTDGFVPIYIGRSIHPGRRFKEHLRGQESKGKILRSLKAMGKNLTYRIVIKEEKEDDEEFVLDAFHGAGYYDVINVKGGDSSKGHITEEKKDWIDKDFEFFASRQRRH